jgi:hypothetical protein
MLNLSGEAYSAKILERSTIGDLRSTSSYTNSDCCVYYFSKTKVLIAASELANENINFIFSR